MMRWSRGLVLLAALTAFAPAGAAGLQWYGNDAWATLRQAHASRPWVVHLWGMSCDPCREELPAWGRFEHEHPGLAVTFIEVEPAAPSAVEAALAQAGLTGSDQWLSADGFDARQRYVIDRHWGGELPLTLLERPDGRVQVITGTMDFRRLGAWAAGAP